MELIGDGLHSNFIRQFINWERCILEKIFLIILNALFETDEMNNDVEASICLSPIFRIFWQTV